MSKTVVREANPAQRVLDYTPRKFDIGVPAPARDFQEIQKERENSFRMSDVLRIQTGLSKIEAEETEEAVERRTLEKLKEIQEAAYQEAYQLGLEEGRKEAFAKSAQDIDTSLLELATLVGNIESLKSELLKQNESHLVKLLLHVGTRLAHHEIQVNNDCVVDIMRRAIEAAQIDEEVTVQVSPTQFEFLESLKNETDRNLEFLKKVKLVPIEAIGHGGCIIETNYGVIDARIEERISKLWESMAENLYRVKDKIGVA